MDQVNFDPQPFVAIIDPLYYTKTSGDQEHSPEECPQYQTPVRVPIILLHMLHSNAYNDWDNQ